MHVSHDSPSGPRVLSTTTFLRRTRAYMYARSQCRFAWPSRRRCNSPKPKASTGHSWPSALRHSSATVQSSILRSSHRYAQYSERLASIHRIPTCADGNRSATAPYRYVAPARRKLDKVFEQFEPSLSNDLVLSCDNVRYRPSGLWRACVLLDCTRATAVPQAWRACLGHMYMSYTLTHLEIIGRLISFFSCGRHHSVQCPIHMAGCFISKCSSETRCQPRNQGTSPPLHVLRTVGAVLGVIDFEYGTAS
jgi:hypothetical protein